MSNNHIDVGGAVVWSTGGRTLRTTLQPMLSDLGYGWLTPNHRTPEALLKFVLEANYPRDLVRPTLDGVEVVREGVGTSEHGNQYHRVLSAAIRPDGRIECWPNDWELATELESQYQDEYGWLTGSQMSAAFVKVIAHMGGISLRDRGAVYFIPVDKLEEFGKIRDVFRQAGHTQVAEAEVRVTSESVTAVRDALERQVLAEVTAITEDLGDPDMGDRALSNRMERITAMRKQLALYQPVLNDALEGLSDSITKLENHEMFLALAVGVSA